MTRCCACKHPAVYECMDNTRIKVCAYHSNELDFIRWRRPANPHEEVVAGFRKELRDHARQFGRQECYGCGGPVFHGGVICPSCRNDVFSYLWHLDAESMSDNPWVYQMALPAIRFSQWLNLTEPAAGESWIKFYPRGEQLQTVTFDRLVKEKENSS